MKGRLHRAGRVLRRGTAGLLALAGLVLAAETAGLSLPRLQPALATQGEGREETPALWQRLLLGDAALLSQWMADQETPRTAPAQEAPTVREDSAEGTEETQILEPPEKLREYSQPEGSCVSGGGVSLYNRTGKEVDLEAVAQGGCGLRFAPGEDGPQILIMHTHGTESFARDGSEPYAETGTAHTTDRDYNIIRVGAEIARVFSEQGLHVLHDTEFYDYPAYDGAYDRSRAGIEGILEEHPSIRMVLDVHRDAMVEADGTVFRPVLNVDGVDTAQVMLLVGSDDAGAAFPDWAEHLALAMEIQTQMNTLWPGLARPITLRTARFNQQLTPGSLLLEVGSHGNSLEEALAGARLFARAAGKVLAERVEG